MPLKGIIRSDTMSSSFDVTYLPTERGKFILNHPDTSMAELQACHPTRIAPQWNKISKTVYYGRAALCGGYGRCIQVS